MRLFRVLLCVLVIGLTIPIPAVAAEPEVSFEGHGWGHGVGMSQYGARAMAASGWSAEDIVEYYYTDAEVVDLSQAVSGWLVDDPEPLWVNITGSPLSTAQQIGVRAAGGSLTICQQEPDWVGNMSKSKNGGVYSDYVKILEQELADQGFSPGAIDGWFDTDTDSAVKEFQAARGLGVDGVVGPNTKNALWPPDSGDRCVIETTLGSTTLTLTPNANGSECSLPGTSSPAGSCRGSIRNLNPSARVVIPQRKVRNGSAIELAHGSLRFRPDIDSATSQFEGVHAVLEVDVDDYVRGIDEVILSWSSGANEALLAQAIASRSYGAGIAKGRGPEASFSSSRKDSCWCHLWSNSYSQVYAGWYAETTYGGVWGDAATDTSGEVLRHPSAGLVTAYFGSSSGGATEANEDAWGSSPVAYLRSVDDPWSLDKANPFANWTYTFSPSSTAAKVGLEELTGVAVVETNQSGSARTVRFTGMLNGVETTFDKSGGWVRAKFGLRSNHYDVAWGEVGAPSPAPPPPPPPSPSPTAGVFEDTAGNTFEADIEWAVENGVTKGCNPPENTRFCPDDEVTRGQMAAFLARFLGLPSTSTDYFGDDNGSTFENDINRLAEAGITKGCGNGKFCPNSKVSREQMAAFLSRAFELTENTHGGFVDVSSSNTFFDDIGKLATAGITKGCNPPSNDRYCPSENVSRAQMTAFLHRAALR